MDNFWILTKKYNMEQKKNLKEQYEKICNAYLDEFCKKYGLDKKETYWIADKIGELLDIHEGVYVIDFCVIRYMIDNNIDWKMFESWDDYTRRLSLINSDIPTPNFENWCKGCPRKSEGEILGLEELQKKAIEAKDAFYDSVKNSLLF